MSRRAWKKRQKLKKSEDKRNRDVVVPFGAFEAPGGAPLAVMDCLSCRKPTTEHWLLKSGRVGCGWCVSDKSSVFLAMAQEEGDDGDSSAPRRHLLAPSDPFTELA